jgi:hypothetical protein
MGIVMKKVKMPVEVYKIYNACNGHEVFVNFKPKKSDIKQLCEWLDWDYDEEDGNVQANFEFTKIAVYGN